MFKKNEKNKDKKTKAKCKMSNAEKKTPICLLLKTTVKMYKQYC